MFLLLGLGASVVTWAAGATTVMVAVKHGWELWAAWEERRKPRDEASRHNCR
jgi:hypothetical protein